MSVVDMWIYRRMLCGVGFGFSDWGLGSGTKHLQRRTVARIAAFVVKISRVSLVSGVFFVMFLRLRLGLNETFFMEEMGYCSRTFAYILYRI
jgi:hypothetical protein